MNNYYTTPNKLFEYMAAGLPIAGSRFPELCRFLDGLDIGRTFDPEDPYELAFTVNTMLDDDELRAGMRARALVAASRYVWEVESQKLVDVYGDVSVSEIRAREDGRLVGSPMAGRFSAQIDALEVG